ncbi:MAG: tyrosinase family protein [Cyanobacteria bacterium P01_D01_bin.105]
MRLNFRPHFSKKKLTLSIFVGVILVVAITIIAIANLRNNSGVYSPPPLNAPGPALVFPDLSQSRDLRTRKSVTALNSAEKSAFIAAVNTLQSTYPDGSQLSLYEQFVVQHILTMGFRQSLGATGPARGNPAHSYPAFLPWHRQFLLDFEQALQAVDASVTIPYWDWSDPDTLDVMLQEDFLGTTGEGTFVEVLDQGRFEGGEVKNGTFAKWQLNEALHFDAITLESLGPHLLRFSTLPPFDRYPLPQSEIDALFETNNYEVFNALIEGALVPDDNNSYVPGWALHAFAHSVIGGSQVDWADWQQGIAHQIDILGTMDSIPCSPYDPIFWLHHANVDRLWAQWQDEGHSGDSFYPASDRPFGHNLADPMWPWDGGLSSPGRYGPENVNLASLFISPEPSKIVSAKDVLNFRQLGYTYASLADVEAAADDPTNREASQA